MNFEHLVEVNDAGNPLVADLSREELWFGLWCRVQDPRAFLPGLDRCEILAQSGAGIDRELHFGAAVIRDRVTYVEQEWVRFESAATEEHAGGSLTITIEEPESGALFLRFHYRTTLPEGAASPEGGYAEFVKSAYHESDLDTVKVIRMIAESGRIQ